MLAFNRLPHVAVEGVFRNIPEYINLAVLVALTQDPAFALLNVRRSPWYVKMVLGNQPLLYVCACSHLCGGTKQDTHIAGANVREQGSFLCLGLCIVNKGNLGFRNAHADKLCFQVIVHIELTVPVRGRQVAEYKLR